MGLLLALSRNINLILKHGQNTKFEKRPIELNDKKALIVGYGGVGTCLAKLIVLECKWIHVNIHILKNFNNLLY